ncbi:tail fiber assembly protein [uncultured Pseudodesulfovibrio sp.]|uniref:tail fiber assembly protein n=1 Tax=uncultured Pseudodesulfovibrio sp. TaxID=2035858 RepID=UPI0029C77BE4|nr:tail fiber assembly protein [uncultured Pseudodesulfovibrio sp.]
MFRYNNGQFRVNPPGTVVDADGFRRKFTDLTREELDVLGYNEAIPLERDSFTVYETSWEKGEDLIYREVVTSAVVDEAARAEAEAVKVRAERDRRLRACDWTVLPDCPLAEVRKTEWADYRQALRDVPQQGGFPEVIDWPVAVETV